MREILGSSTLLTGLDKILRAGSTPNGVFGGKLQWSHFRRLAVLLTEQADTLPVWAPGAFLRMLEWMPEMMPTHKLLEVLRAQVTNRPKFTTAYAWFRERLPDLRFVRLTRNNMVARAISHSRALHSGSWHRSRAAGSGAESTPAPVYDFSELHKIYVMGLFQEEMWQWFFEYHSISPHHVVYEDLAADYAGTLRRVTEFLGIEYPPDKFAPPTSSPQADALSVEGEQRYREESSRL